ncbi:MAG: exo-alpha-sialidase, partial [Myxococcales bacterium]|nr:exo-alpha-sialidase [Myxococcales bacterium]
GTNYREIYRAFSNGDGASFIGDAKVNVGSTSTVDSFGIEVARSGANVYAVWETFVTDRTRHIFFARSTNGGNTWSTEQQLSTPSGSTFVAANPQIAAAGSNVYVVWRDNRNGSLDLYLRRSTNDGGSFGGETRIDVGDAAGSGSSFSPSIGADGTNVYVAWVDDRDMGSFDIWLNRSQDSGATWRSSAVQLDMETFSHDSIEPHVVALPSGRAVVSWIDYRYGFPDPLATYTDDGGDTWDAPQRLDTSTGAGVSGSYDLAIGGDGNLVVAAWADDRMGFLDVYANFSLDGGVTWQPQDYRLDSSGLGTSDSENPYVYVGGTTAHVVWEDHRSGSGCTRPIGSECPEADLFYRRLR